MSGNKQTILRSNTSLTLLLFFSTPQYHHYPTTRHDDLDQYGTTTCSTLCSQYAMFYQATSFDQPLLYCNWHNKSASALQSGGNDVCDRTVTCGWGNETCPPTASPTATPTASPTATPTANPTNSTVLPDADTPGAGGGKAAI